MKKWNNKIYNINTNILGTAFMLKKKNQQLKKFED